VIKMLNRREFVQGGLCATALAASGVALAADASRLPIYKVVIDERFAASRAFGAQAARLGAELLPTQGDVTSIWYSDLYFQWKNAQPGAIAGLTTESALFCLDILARDVGMRVVYRGDHCAANGVHFEHQAVGPADVVREITALGSSAAWANTTATALLACPKNDLRPTALRVGPALAAADVDSSTALVSWIIASPAKRA
jgi:hypothetical protein